MKPVAEVAAEVWGADAKYIDGMVSTLECAPTDVTDTFSCKVRFNDAWIAEWPTVKFDGDRTYVGETCFASTYKEAGLDTKESRECKRLPEHADGS